LMTACSWISNHVTVVSIMITSSVKLYLGCFLYEYVRTWMPSSYEWLSDRSHSVFSSGETGVLWCGHTVVLVKIRFLCVQTQF
jgi:hypothetical protein